MASKRSDIKAGRYQRLRRQLDEELPKQGDPIARMATMVAILHHKQPHFFWTGFYRQLEGRLVVGPYQGSLACQTIEIGQGVCGTAFEQNETLVVEDVHRFPGHIACDARSRSEIVVPFRDRSGQVTGVLDVDSAEVGAFDEVDRRWLEEIVALL